MPRHVGSACRVASIMDGGPLQSWATWLGLARVEEYYIPLFTVTVMAYILAMLWMCPSFFFELSKRTLSMFLISLAK